MPHLTWQWSPCFKNALQMCHCPKCLDERLKAWQEKHQTSLMLCEHEDTEMKLVSWAEVCKGKHTQGFVMKKCCARCGAVIGE